MNRLSFLNRAALAALAFMGLVHPCVAQQSTQDLVPFKAVIKHGLTTPVVVIPGTPPLSVSIFDMTGEADFLGPVKYVELHPVQLGVDGKGIGVINAVGAMTAANGDEIHLSYYGVVRPTVNGAEADFALVITGGKGRFANATGSGHVKGLVDRPQSLTTLTFDALISRPKP